MKKKIIIILVLLVILAGGGFASYKWWRHRSSSNQEQRAFDKCKECLKEGKVSEASIIVQISTARNPNCPGRNWK